ncbi:MAG: AAA family ATPase [Flavisolibacter sp.]|nr:AAA family ATPase [Flavisolibacter sp.]
MVKEIDIKKFGQFNNYNWTEHFGNALFFKKLNIIYGRNYSGKTTLSRIFRCIEKKEMHRHYCDSQFQFKLYDGSLLSNSDVKTYEGPLKFRVYNNDFVKENLSWLHNPDGTIIPFTILGEVNVELDKQIRDIDTQLGSVESSSGLIFQFHEKQVGFAEKEKNLRLKSEGLEKMLQEKAKFIKNDTATYAIPVYYITHIKKEIDSVTDGDILSSPQKEEFLKLLSEQPKPDIKGVIQTQTQFQSYYSTTKEIVEKRISPSKPITDLVQDALLQAWVRDGIDKHKGKRSTCGFCGNPLPADLWEKLDAHFVKESEDLRRRIETLVETLEKSKVLLESFLLLKAEQFYFDLQERFKKIEQRWVTETDEYKLNIDVLISEVKKRKEDIFQDFELLSISDNSEKLLEIITEFNVLIEEHNKRTKTLSEDQNAAREKLRLSEVAEFKKLILYQDQLDEIEIKKNELEAEKSDKITLEGKVGQLIEEKRILVAKSKDETRGAELVNRYLSHFFGHEELKLIAFEDEDSTQKFKIQRDNIDANNLSEGECSLISFCYFIAKMEDELKVESNSLIIYIDDPISSLDSNHTFFIFSLIETVIAKSVKYHQLFISTHNLDFLKYIKRLTKPKGDETSYFLMQKRSKSLTMLVKAPDYLKKYITEFNFLFNEIYQCASESEEVIAEKHQYNFGNNVRKFLEAYLFFKYPDQSLSAPERLQKFFALDMASYNLVNRLYNEFSHLEEQFDRSVVPIDVSEFKKVAIIVLKKIKESDVEQYCALCKSVGQDSTIDFDTIVPIEQHEDLSGPY